MRHDYTVQVNYGLSGSEWVDLADQPDAAAAIQRAMEIVRANQFTSGIYREVSGAVIHARRPTSKP